MTYLATILQGVKTNQASVFITDNDKKGTQCEKRTSLMLKTDHCYTDWKILCLDVIRLAGWYTENKIQVLTRN